MAILTLFVKPQQCQKDESNKDSFQKIIQNGKYRLVFISYSYNKCFNVPLTGKNLSEGDRRRPPTHEDTPHNVHRVIGRMIMSFFRDLIGQ